MAWSDAARAAAAEMRRRKASGKSWRLPQRAKLQTLRSRALAAKQILDHHPQRSTGRGRDYSKAVTEQINAKRKLNIFYSTLKGKS